MFKNSLEHGACGPRGFTEIDKDAQCRAPVSGFDSMCTPAADRCAIKENGYLKLAFEGISVFFAYVAIFSFFWSMVIHSC